MTRRIEHVPALDGLRGLALVGVLLFHADGALTGGYLGVDLFFVLSGFLITSILLVEHQDTGRIDLKNFWIRRARRLFPALLALMPAVGILARWVAKPMAVVAIRWDALATLGYVANWRAVFSHKSYWELFTSTSPLEHTWSLSIEEQFYVVWPIVVVLVLRFWNRRALLVITIACAALSMAAMLLLFDPEKTTRAYYGTDTRATAILAGAVLAMVLPRTLVLTQTKARLVDAIGFVALAGLGAAWWTIDGNDTFLYHGGFWLTEVAAVVVIACGVSSPNGILARVVSIPPLRLLGLVSYGAYLWHWPINVLFTADRMHVHGLALQALRLGTTFAVAAISYRFLEQPIRARGLPFGRPRWVVPASIALATGIVLACTVRRPIPPVSPPIVQAVPVRWRIRMIGDSTASSLGWALRGDAPLDVAIDLHHQDGLNLLYADDVRWPSDEPRSDVTLVVLGGAFLYGIHVDGKWTKACHPKWDRMFEDGLDRHLAQLDDAKSRTWIATTPYPLGSYESVTYRREVDCINASARKVAANHDIRILDVNAMLCPRGECYREVGGVSVRPDGLHYDIEGAHDLARGVLEQLDPRASRDVRDR